MRSWGGRWGRSRGDARWRGALLRVAGALALDGCSFQRKLESILILLWCFLSSATAGGHSRLWQCCRRFRRPQRAPTHLSLLVQSKVGQRKDTPRTRPPRILRSGSVRRGRGFRRYVHVPAKTRALPAIAPALLYLGHPCPRLRAPLRADPTPPHRARGAPLRAAHIPVRRSAPRYVCCRVAGPFSSSSRRKPGSILIWLLALGSWLLALGSWLLALGSCFCAQEARALGAPVPRRGGEGKPEGSRAGEGMDARGRAMQGQLPDAREFLVGTWTCRRETPEPTRAPGAQGCAEGAAPGCPFFGPPFFWTSTAPQERRERRRRPEGRRAACPESRKVGRRPLRATKPATAPLKASVSARCGEARQRQQRDQGGFQLSLE
jgi:hypothetical protein